MTGYSFKESFYDNFYISTEIKTVNSRFLEININLPTYLYALEINIRDLLKQKLMRGKIDVNVILKLNEDFYNVNVDLKLAKKYIEGLNNIINNFNLKDEVRLFHLTKYDNIISTEKNKNFDKYWKYILKNLNDNLDEILVMRKKEGDSIKKDLTGILKNIKKEVTSVSKKIPQMEKEIYISTKNKIKDLIGENVDEVRLLNEAAFYVSKSCINEEVKRLFSHIEQFDDIIKEKREIGKRLDFICQEMHREINTIGSKISLVELTGSVISVKNNIEKMREQIRNIE